MEKHSKVPEIIFLCAVIALSVAVLIMSRGFTFRAFLLPVVGVVPAGLLAIHQLLRLAMGKPSDSDAGGAVDYAATPEIGDGDDQPAAVATGGAVSEPLAPHWMSFAWLAALSALVYIVGLLWGSLMFTVLYMRFRAGDRLRPILLVVATTGSVFLLLVNFLGAPIYRGLLFR